MLQMILRIEFVTRRTRDIRLEIVDAACQVFIEAAHDAGRLSDRREQDRELFGLSSDQLRRIGSLVTVLSHRFAMSPDKPINLANEGDKPLEQFFSLVRVGLNNWDTVERTLAQIVWALLDTLNWQVVTAHTPNVKHSPVTGAISWPVDQHGSIDAVANPREVRQWTVDFLLGEPARLNAYLDNVQRQLAKQGGMSIPVQSEHAAKAIIGRLLRGLQKKGGRGQVQARDVAVATVIDEGVADDTEVAEIDDAEVEGMGLTADGDGAARRRGGMVVRKVERVAAAERLIRLGNAVLAAADAGDVHEVDLWEEIEGPLSGTFLVAVTSALVARAPCQVRVAGESAVRRLKSTGSMTIVQAGAHITSSAAGGLPLCVVAWDSIVKPQSSGRYQFELDALRAPAVPEDAGGAREETLPDRDTDGQLLRAAAFAGDAAAVQRLLAAGANPADVDALGFAAVHSAAAGGDAGVMTLLIEQAHVDVNAISRYGATPLHVACLKGHLAVALLLLENGANREARDARGRTPLFEAVSGRQDEFIEAMLSPEVADVQDGGPIDVNAAATDGTPMLMTAVELPSFDIVFALLTAGADRSGERGGETARRAPWSDFDRRSPSRLSARSRRTRSA
jgi:hypothetical protein